MSERVMKVLANMPQGLSEPEQAQARANIGAVSASEVPPQVNADWDAVSGAAQILNKPTIPPALSAGTNIDITNNAVSVSMTASSTSASSYREAVNSVSQSADGSVSASTRKVVGSEWTLCQANSSTSNKILKIAEFSCYSGFRYVGSGYTNLVVKVSDADDARMYTVGVGIMQAANGNHNFSASLRSVLDYKRENATQPIKSFYLFSDTPYGNNQSQATLSLWVEFDTLEYNSWTFEALLNTAVGGTGSDYNENAWTFANGRRYTESALPTGGWQLNSGAPAIVNVPPVGSSDNNKVLTAKYSSGTGTYEWGPLPSQVNADWDATSGISMILNKPTIPTVPTIDLVNYSESVSIEGGQFVNPETYSFNKYIPVGQKFYGTLAIQMLYSTSNATYIFELGTNSNTLTCNFGDYAASRQSGHVIPIYVDNTNGSAPVQLFFTLAGQFESQTLSCKIQGITIG